MRLFFLEAGYIHFITYKKAEAGIKQASAFYTLFMGA